MKRYARETELFVFAQTGGPISMIDEMLPMEDYLVYCLTNPDEIEELSQKIMEYELEKAILFIDSGADGIFLADDMAFNSGLFLPPQVMKQLVYPHYKKLVSAVKAYKDIPIIFHSDGNINTALQDIAECGFDGLHSLQPSAGMDLAKVKADYGEKLCLWGNIDLNLLSFGSDEKIRSAVRTAMEEGGKQRGYIFSSCNTLMDSIPVENVWSMIDEAKKCRTL